ncbi:MAG: hypothetical protein WDO74_35685 [Pseudomonadota bacterium]
MNSASKLQTLSCAEVDQRLTPALEVLQASLSGVTVAFFPWAELQTASLLPFHLHVRWADRVSWLPLNAKLAFLPFLHDQLSELRIYPPLAAEKWRKGARAARHSAGGFKNDFACPDWERAIARNRDDFGDVLLPGAAFVSVDEAMPSGVFRRGSRGTLGRRTGQDLVRPQLLTCSRSALGEAHLAQLDEVDLLIIDLQGTTGAATQELARALLTRRSVTRRTLVVASTPSELVPIADVLTGYARTSVVGSIPKTPQLIVHAVGEDRVLADRSLDFGLQVEPGAISAAYFVARQAKHAWWAIRQRVALGDSPVREHEAFQKALGLLTERDPTAARQFSHVAQLLLGALKGEQALERRRAIAAAALSTPGRGDTAILTRDETEASSVRELLATELGVPGEALSEFGIYVRPYYWRRRAYRAANAVLCGYFGKRSIDAALRCHPSTLHLIADPTERRAAWFGLHEQCAALAQMTGLEPIASTLTPLLHELERHTQATGLAAGVDLVPSSVSHSCFDENERTLPRPPAGSILIVFADGSSVFTPEGTRFDVLGRVGGYLRTKAARDLERGDETIVVNDNHQARFSEFVLGFLDDGPLKPFAEKRGQWLAIVQAAVSMKNVSTSTILKRLEAGGYEADRASVRAWTGFGSLSEAAVPQSFLMFSALAKAIEVALPEVVLRDLFSAIRRVRTVHRLAGRELARAIRFAHLGILDAPSQEKLKRTWGIEPARLLDAARLATIDHVLR